jgi:hypothetical protein
MPFAERVNVTFFDIFENCRRRGHESLTKELAPWPVRPSRDRGTPIQSPGLARRNVMKAARGGISVAPVPLCGAGVKGQNYTSISAKRASLRAYPLAITGRAQLNIGKTRILCQPTLAVARPATSASILVAFGNLRKAIEAYRRVPQRGCFRFNGVTPLTHHRSFNDSVDT